MLIQSGSDSPTDPKLGSFSRNRMPLPGHSWLLRNCLSTSVRRRKSGSYPAVFSAGNIRKERTRLHHGTAYTGTWRIFGKDNPQGIVKTTPNDHRVFKQSKRITKSDLFKKWEKIKISAPLWCRLYRFCWGGGAKTDPLFVKKTCFITLSRYITVGGSVWL